jgi:hypothetical protein
VLPPLNFCYTYCDEKRRDLLQSTKSKIILAVVVLFIVALVVVLVFNAKRKTDQTTEPKEFIQTPEATSGSLPTYSSDQTETRTAIAGFPVSKTPPTPAVPTRTSASATARATNSPVAGLTSLKPQNTGDLDWTKHQANLKTLTIDPQKLEQINANPDICSLSGIGNNWSNPFEKTICGVEQFFFKQVAESLNEMACSFMGSAYSLNFSENIRSNYIDERCYIIDR